MTSSGWYGLPLHTGTKTYEPILQTTFTRRLKNQSGAAMLKKASIPYTEGLGTNYQQTNQNRAPYSALRENQEILCNRLKTESGS